MSTAALRKADTGYKREQVRHVHNMAGHRKLVANLPEPSGPPKRLKDDFSDLFTFDKGTVGSDILLLRGYMKHMGLPEIPETVGVHTFATLFCRFVLPRREWKVFRPTTEDRAEARAFIRQWAKVALPAMLNSNPQSPRKLHARMIPELSAYYDPRYFGIGAQ